jgi:general stress protein YciG
MPKPVKKQPARKRRPASDPNRRAHQMLDEHLAKLEQGKWKDAPTPDVTPPHGDPFEEQYRKRMSDLGRKGGKVSGAKRMEMPSKKRRDIAMKAAKARWAKKNGPAQS